MCNLEDSHKAFVKGQGACKRSRQDRVQTDKVQTDRLQTDKIQADRVQTDRVQILDRVLTE